MRCTAAPILGLFLSLWIATPAASSEAIRPNVILVLADDLGYGEIGSYGQQRIHTPQLDEMAAQGLRFTQLYAGSTICAPSRSVLMTGQHVGQTWVRGNASNRIQSLRPEDFTIAEQLQSAGYATAMIGKWGLGTVDTGSSPGQQGFDYFFGYVDQKHAHNYFPPFLIRNDEKVRLRNVPASDEDADLPSGAGWAETQLDYSHDLFVEDALEWISQDRERPFLLFLSLTIPHANNERFHALGDGQEVPDYGRYADEDWPTPYKGQAAMITRMDRDMGRLMERLRELDIDSETLLIFSSDNGPHEAGGNSPDWFDASGGLRGRKRDLYEGGIRVPMIVWWPGAIEPGRTSHAVAYQGDFMATFSELAGASLPPDLHSVSLVPTILDDGRQQDRAPYLYWEHYARGSRQAVRFEDWKAVRIPMFTGKTELYDLSADPSESNDVAAQHPELVARMEAMMTEAHVPNPNWGFEWWRQYYDRIMDWWYAP